MNIEQKFLLDYVGHCINKVTPSKAEPFIWNSEYQDIKWEQVKLYIKKYNLYAFWGLNSLQDERFHLIANDAGLRVQAMASIARLIEQDYSWNEVKQAFETAKIDCIALKGIIVKGFYPIDVMRTMHDIDILYKEEQDCEMEKALNSIGFTRRKRALKHDHFMDDSGVHLEMHREMVDADTAYYEYYKNVWGKVNQLDGLQHVFELTLEDLYIYNIVHMKEHLIHDAMSIKMIVDIYIMQKECQFNKEYIFQELNKINLHKFEKHIVAISMKWFEKGCRIEKSDEEYELSELILGNYKYDVDNMYPSYYSYYIGNSKFRYLLDLTFPSLKRMKTSFVWLKKYPYLLPFAWIVRIVRALFTRIDIVKVEANKAKRVNAETYKQGKELSKILQKYGL